MGEIGVAESVQVRDTGLELIMEPGRFIVGNSAAAGAWACIIAACGGQVVAISICSELPGARPSARPAK